MLKPEILSVWEPYALSCCEGYNVQEGICYSCGWSSARMEPTAVLVVFRGRNTSAIENDALAHLGERLDVETAATAVVCRDGDTLAEQGDLTIADFLATLKWLCQHTTKIFVICNGGTTAQLLGVISGLQKANRKFIAVDCQRETVTEYEMP